MRNIFLSNFLQAIKVRKVLKLLQSARIKLNKLTVVPKKRFHNLLLLK